MKFEQKYPDAKINDKFEFEYTYVSKKNLGACVVCESFTRWANEDNRHVCSEECGGKLNHLSHKQDDYKKAVETELAFASVAREATKDIIIVVHDQLDYVKNCIESVRKHTENYTLYIWDNASNAETMQYLEDLQEEHATGDFGWDIEVWRFETNVGFIKPNNQLAQIGTGEYIILLNSDTEVSQNWDTTMIGWLQQNPNVSQVGYWGGHLGPDGRGFGGDNGYEVDYISGSCFCISRETYNKHGLFDQDNLNFAYCEDADFSLRLLESGEQIYALHIGLVEHFQNKTIQAVKDEGCIDVRATFEDNHKYIRSRWGQYLSTQRVLVRRMNLNV